MRVRPVFVPAALFLFTACAGGGPAAPAGLAYRMPPSSVVTYAAGDTSNMDIDAGGQSMQARATARATLSAAFSRAPDGVQVALTVTDLDGRLSTPMSSASADENGITGPLVLNLDRQGRVTVVSQPDVSDEAMQFFQPLATANSFFPRLPGRGVEVGETWTDTITYEGAQGPGQVTGVSILTYTAVGDTVVAGRSVMRMDVKGTSEATSSGVITGMDFSQTVKGDVTGWVLFDPREGLMVESCSDGDLRGSMEVPAAPFPLGLRLRSRSWIKLQPQG